ncbi:hypothetical protein K438DRAFT_1769075 [Mycena galopus ATCC 62051]|nr:hypothetical protein K438DRAFT_1769075 [Mycena galopus ATCC 62051]
MSEDEMSAPPKTRPNISANCDQPPLRVSTSGEPGWLKGDGKVRFGSGSRHFSPNAEPEPQVRFRDCLNLNLNLAFGVQGVRPQKIIKPITVLCGFPQYQLQQREPETLPRGLCVVKAGARGRDTKKAEVEVAGMG